jgi:hypothetical protein
MKKTALLLVLVALTLASCSKQERTERKLVDAMLSDDYEASFAAMDEFFNWIKTDKSTMTHDFNYSREKLGMKVNTSSDGQVRTYSWVTGKSDSISTYANIVQWLYGDNLIGFTGPLDAMLTGRKPTIKRTWSLAHSIDTIYDIEGANPPIYMFVESYTNEKGKTFTYISAGINQGLKIAILPFFFNGIETAGNREYIDDGKLNHRDLIKWDAKAKKLYAYVTDENLHVIPGKYEVYNLTATRFVKEENKEENQEQ